MPSHDVQCNITGLRSIANNEESDRARFMWIEHNGNVQAAMPVRLNVKA
jgi:hypothetical protein